jgi:quercetin dioxygenase-like cupin family protein
VTLGLALGKWEFVAMRVIQPIIASMVLSVGMLTGGSLALADEKITPLLKQSLEGLEGKEANIALIEVSPGHETERHTHPGHVFLYVLEGEVELDLEGHDPMRVKAGEAAYELPNVPMVGRNVSSQDGARLLLFQVGDENQELTVPAPE